MKFCNVLMNINAYIQEIIERNTGKRTTFDFCACVNTCV